MADNTTMTFRNPSRQRDRGISVNYVQFKISQGMMKRCVEIVGIFLLLAVTCVQIEGYKILGVFPTGAKSHWAVGEGIMKALGEAGHEVTSIGAFDTKYPSTGKYRHVFLKGIYEELLKDMPEDFMDHIPIPLMSYMIIEFGIRILEMSLENENFKAFMAEDNSFDLVIVESFGAEAFYILAEHFNAPLIAVSTTVNTIWLNDAIGNVEPWSLVPNQLLQGNPEMGFSERIFNVFYNSIEKGLTTFYGYPAQNRVMKKHFPNSSKSVQQMIREDVCLAFVNTHFTISLPRAYVPNMIEIGGINIDRKLNRIPDDFKAFLDSATDGAILFSMGSILQASNMQEQQITALKGAFGKLKQKVIWRYNLPDAADLPENIMAREWLPQKEIMAHPNVRLFITHGGMLGTTEGFYYGVPMIGIPVFGDQPVNIARTEYRGYALRLDKSNLTETSLLWAIREILDNPKYRERVQSLSSAYHDQPMTPQETVVYWAEYVIKHKCARFMKIAGHQKGLIEYHNLDVWFVITVSMVGVIVLIWVLTRFVSKLFCRSKNNNKSYKKKVS